MPRASPRSKLLLLVQCGAKLGETAPYLLDHHALARLRGAKDACHKVNP